MILTPGLIAACSEAFDAGEYKNAVLQDGYRFISCLIQRPLLQSFDLKSGLRAVKAHVSCSIVQNDLFIYLYILYGNKRGQV
jgi:hypothetical protein